jgi:hypothetical protein
LSIAVIKSNFSLEPPHEAFRGLDAEVCAIIATAVAEQKKIIEAATQAGVKCFLLSEFECNTTNAEAVEVPKGLQWKANVAAHLKQTSWLHVA